MRPVITERPPDENDGQFAVEIAEIDGGEGGNSTFQSVGFDDNAAAARRETIAPYWKCITKGLLENRTGGMKRRTYLASSVAALTGIAGCGDPGPGVNETVDSPTEFPDDDDAVDESPTGSPTEDGEESPTDTEAGSPTEDGTPTETGTETETDTEAPSVEMVTEDETFYFDPIGLAVEPGTTVEWTLDSGEHSSTAYEDRIPEEAEAWDSGVLTEDGATFSHTFDAEGTYDYYCTPHQTQGMVGRIVVGEPGGPAEDSMPPDGELPDSQRIVEDGTVSYEAFTSE